MANILYFGRMGDVSGTFSENLDLPPSILTVKDLRKWMEDRFECEGAFLEETIRVAVNSEIAGDTSSLSNSDEIAFMPPVGGG